jgi:hypothetical protein
MLRARFTLQCGFCEINSYIMRSIVITIQNHGFQKLVRLPSDLLYTKLKIRPQTSLWLFQKHEIGLGAFEFQIAPALLFSLPVNWTWVPLSVNTLGSISALASVSTTGSTSTLGSVNALGRLPVRLLGKTTGRLRVA